MSKFHSYILSATKLMETYAPGKPLSLHTRAFFSAQKKYGSKDRRMISSLCYAYFRVKRAFEGCTLEETMLAGLFLCEDRHNELLHFFRSDLDERITIPLSDKLSFLGKEAESFFPFTDELGNGIDPQTFAMSILKQPRLFLRIRPGKEEKVTGKLKEADVAFERAPNGAIVLANNVQADKILELNRDAVVQDLSSQQALDFLVRNPRYFVGSKKITAWDCCAGSGGKSILLSDRLNGSVILTVSDIRENILANLAGRLRQAGINLNRSFVADLSVAGKGLPDLNFDLVICDVPCTGSGTWSRNPEQLADFDENKIGEFAARQQKITSTAIRHLNPGGLLFYITCSVFKKENEEIVSFIQGSMQQLELLESGYIKGYTHLADTMFVAVFKNA